jgi:hypothetical protein
MRQTILYNIHYVYLGVKCRIFKEDVCAGEGLVHTLLSSPFQYEPFVSGGIDNRVIICIID